MNDYTISRREALDAMCDNCDSVQAICAHFPCTRYRAVEELKPAQPERKKGEWIEKSTNGEMFSRCSVCGYIEWDTPRYFCPNCGSDNRGGK